MSSAALKTKQDVQDKLNLERSLERKINSLNRKIVSDFKREYAKNNHIITAESYRDELENILQKHYEKTGDVFNRKLSEIMPEEFAITEDERNVIFEALALYYILRSGDQSRIITDTTEENIRDSVEQGTQLANQEEIGFDRVAAAVLSAGLLTRFLRNRTSAIVVTETQNIAETAKITEAEVLSGLEPSISSNSARKLSIKKQWVTVGDERVRETHIEADGQEKDMNEPYEVGGQLLMYPGDTSLGATAKEIVHCRCSSQVDEEQIINLRKDRGQ